MSPHGLRAGLITEAYKAGVRDQEVTQHSRHKDVRTMHGYVRRARLLQNNVVKKVGL